MKKNHLSRNSWKESHQLGELVQTQAFQAHEGKLYVETTQPSERAILEDNKRRRAVSDSHSIIRRGLRIPTIHLQKVAREFPELFKGTPDEQRSAMTRIMLAHPEWVQVQHTPKFHSIGRQSSAG